MAGKKGMDSDECKEKAAKFQNRSDDSIKEEKND